MKKQKKSFLLVISLVLLLTVSVAGTLAYLAAATGAVVNTFQILAVPNQVVEDTANGVKKDVKIENIGTADAYIRAAVVVTWVDSETGTQTYHEKPKVGEDYTIAWNTEATSGWMTGDDGFYYYKHPVAPKSETTVNNKTAVLFTDCKAVAGTAPDGYSLSVEIMGQSIQAGGISSSGKHPVEEAWPAVKVAVDNKNTETTDDDTYQLELNQ